MAKLDVRAFGLASGILWGGFVILFGLSAIICPWAKIFVDWLAPFYVGYGADLLGSLIGGIWGFCDAGIGAGCLAWLYNKLAR